MSKNFLICALGIALGFVLGFFITNAVAPPLSPASPSSARAASDSQAGPLRPEQVSGELPQGHPPVNDDAGDADGGGSAASTSSEAQAAMDKADRAPKEFQPQLDAARVFYGLHDYDKAALYGNRALALKGNDSDALTLLGNAKYDARDFEAAAVFYERSLAVRPDSPDLRTDLGNTYFNRGDYDRAVAEYRKSVAIDPDHLNSWKNLAAAALRKRDKALLSEAVEQLSRIAPQSEETETYRQQLAQMQ
ncbi:MAG TPA: tetratricopeptide repeat protein [Pyrinomonadaceae bacterium]|jgi:tetratricopeptide (TPR) repeat protein|nr:tetratricopeptide repeat protein [Pyrinomonadaceae bacterium]